MTIGRDDNSVAVAHPLFIVSAALCSSYDPALGLDCSAPQKDLPMKPSSWDGESRRVQEGFRPLATQSQCGFRESQIETYQAAELTQNAGKRRDDLMSWLDGITLFQPRPVGSQINIKDVQLLVSMSNLPLFVNPDQGILDPFRRWIGRFVDANVDQQGVVSGGLLKATDEEAFGGILTQPYRFRCG